MDIVETMYGGIDPGADGALGIINAQGQIVMRELLPKTDKKVNPKALLGMLLGISLKYPGVRMGLEQVGGRGGGGAPRSATANFSFGKTCGWIEMALIAAGIPYVYITPQRWQKEMHAGMSKDMGPKVRSLTVAERIFPHEAFRATEKCKKAHDGIVDGLLIAEFMRRGNL